MNENHHLFAGNEAARRRLREEFLRWQCRVRRWAVREQDGRPAPGMCPLVYLPDAEDALGNIVTLMVPREPVAAAREFHHTARKTLDPARRHAGALRLLGAEYYQRAEAFTDELTALFGPGSGLARRLLAAAACTLDFEQSGRGFTLPCAVGELRASDPRFQATYWHNCLFNPAMPPGVSVLVFTPDWARALASGSP